MLRRAVSSPAMLVVLAALVSACGSDADPAGEPGSVGPHGKRPREGAPANAVGGFSIRIPELQLGPGEETTPCFIFPLELDGPSHFIAAAAMTTSAGLHHGNVTTRPKTGEGIRECEPQSGLAGSEAADIFKGGSVLFGSSTQITGVEWRTFPEGMAFRIKDGYEIVARMHYLNASSKPVTVAPRYDWYTIPEDSVTQEIGAYFWQISGFEIPPQSTYTAQAECFFYEEMHIVDAMPHMHRLGTNFTVGFLGGEQGGTNFLEEKGYDPDQSGIRQYEPAIDLSQGDGASFSCTWDNVLDKTIVEGIGDNEMCMLFGYAYPPENAFSAVATTSGQCAAILPPPPDAN